MTKKEKYKLLINARNFHYENFNKWQTYFYIAIGALFVGYGSVTSSKEGNIMLEYLLIVLGFIVSLLWYWSAKGYYYWNINFINLVNYYERDILKFDKRERVYSFFANKKVQNNFINPISGANISTSKVAILFAFIIATSWAFILCYTILDCIFDWRATYIVVITSLVSSVLIITLSALIPYYFMQSKIVHFPDLQLKFTEQDSQLDDKENKNENSSA